MLVIIPTYNESSNIESAVRALQNQKIPVSILIIDDNSVDGTGELADKIARENKDVFVIHRSKKLGLGSAYIEGFLFALERKFDYVCEMDADLSHDPRYLSDFYKELKDNDLVIGSRYLNGVSIVHWPMHRLALSFLANKLTKLVTGLPFSDCTGGYKCIRSEVIRAINPRSIICKGYLFQMEVLYRAYINNFKIKEIPIIFYNRQYGKSKMSIPEIVTSFFLLFYLRFKLALAKKGAASCATQ